jgi:hypothetical protein
MPIYEYKLNLDTKTEIKLNRINIEIKDSSDFWYDSGGNYLWEILENEKILNYSYFDIEGFIYYDIVNPSTGLIDDGGKKEIKLNEKGLFIPYYPNANKISIFKFNQSTEFKELVLEIDVSRFAKNLTTPKEKIEEKEEGINISTKSEGIEETAIENSFYIPFLIIIVLVALLVFLLRDKIFNRKR